MPPARGVARNDNACLHFDLPPLVLKPLTARASGFFLAVLGVSGSVRESAPNISESRLVSESVIVAYF